MDHHSPWLAMWRCVPLCCVSCKRAVIMLYNEGQRVCLLLCLGHSYWDSYEPVGLCVHEGEEILEISTLTLRTGLWSRQHCVLACTLIYSMLTARKIPWSHSKYFNTMVRFSCALPIGKERANRLEHWHFRLEICILASSVPMWHSMLHSVDPVEWVP